MKVKLNPSIYFLSLLVFINFISFAQIPENELQNSSEKNERRQLILEKREELQQEKQETRQLNKQQRQENRENNFCEKSLVSLNNRKERVSKNLQRLSSNFDKTNLFLNNKITEFQDNNLDIKNLDSKFSYLNSQQQQILSEQSNYLKSLTSFDTNLCLSNRKSYVENLKKLNTDTKNSRTKFGTYSLFLRSEVISEVKRLQESLKTKNE
jgi:chromosome segregation ATPase